MPSRSFLDNQPTTPSNKHHSVVVEPGDNATTSPLTSSLGGSPARTTGDRTPEYPLARAGVMSHYPPHHHQNQHQSQHPPQGTTASAATSAAGRDPRYVQMVSAGTAPHFQGHVAYLPPNIPQLYQTPGGAGGHPHTYASPPPGSYPPHAPPPQQQHQGHQTYVIAGYPPGHGHQHGHAPPPGSQFFAVNAVPPGSYPGGGAYPPHHAPPGQHPPSPHHPHGRPPHHGAHHPAHHHPHHPQGATSGGTVYVRHGPPGSAPPPGATAASYPVMYAQQPPPPRGSTGAAPPHGAVSASTASAVSKTSTHPSDKEAMGGTSGEVSKSSHPHRHHHPHHHHEPMQSMEDMQAEREKEEMAMEQVLKSVKPIQTDYHLFIEEEMKKYKDLAAKDGADDAYLRNSSLNYRLKAAWERLEPSQRAIYLKREELDRKRFMEEEEIASRHCATLTARNSTPTTRKKSQSTAEVTVDDDDDDEHHEQEDEARDDPSKRARDDKDESLDQNESPTKKERIEQEVDAVEQV